MKNFYTVLGLAILLIFLYNASMDIRQHVLDKVENYCEKTGMSEYALSRAIGKDGNMINRLRKYRFRLDTAQMILDYVEKNSPETKQ